MLDKLRRLASSANTLLENEAFREAVEELEQDYLRRWKSTGLNKVEERERLFMAVNVLKDVTDRLGSYHSKYEYEKSRK